MEIGYNKKHKACIRKWTNKHPLGQQFAKMSKTSDMSKREKIIWVFHKRAYKILESEDSSTFGNSESVDEDARLRFLEKRRGGVRYNQLKVVSVARIPRFQKSSNLTSDSLGLCTFYFIHITLGFLMDGSGFKHVMDGGRRQFIRKNYSPPLNRVYPYCPLVDTQFFCRQLDCLVSFSKNPFAIPS